SAFKPAVSTSNVIFGGDVKIVADMTANALVIAAAKQDYEIVKSILSKLDAPRDQVFIEGILLELNAKNTHAWGVNYYTLVSNTFAGRSGFISSSSAVSSFLTPSETGGVLGFGGGATVKVRPPTGPNGAFGDEIEIPSLIGF